MVTWIFPADASLHACVCFGGHWIRQSRSHLFTGRHWLWRTCRPTQAWISCTTHTLCWLVTHLISFCVLCKLTPMTYWTFNILLMPGPLIQLFDHKWTKGIAYSILTCPPVMQVSFLLCDLTTILASVKWITQTHKSTRLIEYHVMIHIKTVFSFWTNFFSP